MTLLDSVRDEEGVDAPEADESVKPRRRRRWLIPVAAVVAGGAAIAVVYSPVMRVKQVRVTGTVKVSTQEVTKLLEVAEKQPLATYDVDAAKARIANIPRVATVDVRRGWPNSLVVVIEERKPIGAVKVADGFALIDATGTPYERVRKIKHLPVLQPIPAEAQAAAVHVLAALPADLAKVVKSVSASPEGLITLKLADDAQVRWGGPEDSELKARVLRSLLQQKADVYDVIEPLLPITKGGKPEDSDNRDWP